MPGGPLEVGYGVSYLSIAIPVFSFLERALSGWPAPAPQHRAHLGYV